jgi:anaerobic ribonucleoside-triphosphate reductase activating protein
MPVGALAERILGWPDIDGLTLSGGEPFEQAGALARLCRTLRSRRDLSILAYSGFLLEEIAADAQKRALLATLDVLVDGPFVRARQADLLWRGSDNQRVHLLTDRHRTLAGTLDGPGAGVELHVSRDGGVFWAGVPEPGFGARLTRLLAEEGIDVTDTGGMWA